jgi:hypothetical protein
LNWRVILSRNRVRFRGSRDGTDTASSLGFRSAALTFLNRLDGHVADISAGLGRMWECRF